MSTFLKGIPSAYRWASFEDPKLEANVRPPSAIVRAREVLHVPLVAIHGPVGAGKSILATAMIRSIPGASFLSLLSFRASQLTWQEKLELRNEAIAAPGLVIDDIGVRKWPFEDDVVDLLETIMHGRAASGRRTILTTSVDRDVVESAYSIAVANWLFNCKVIHLDPSYNCFREYSPDSLA